MATITFNLNAASNQSGQAPKPPTEPAALTGEVKEGLLDLAVGAGLGVLQVPYLGHTRLMAAGVPKV
jgi:hypothetical protein